MSEETRNTVMDYAAQRFAPQGTETPSETAIVDETTVTNEAPVTTEIVEATTTEAPAESTTSNETAVDYSKILSEVSEGLFTDVESFKQALPKVKEYDSLLTSKTELEEKLKVSPFANDYVKTVNEMLLAGKSADEVENFTKISKLDIDALDAREVKVMRYVKDGFSEAVARQKVELDFPIEDYDEGSPKRAVLEEELRISSNEDRRVLKEYKKELTAVDNTAKEQAEQQRLDGIAKAEAHKQQVKQIVPKIAETFTGLGEKNLNGKDGDEAVKLNFEYNQDFKSQLPQMLENFFLDSNMPVTEENIAIANHYVKADYLAKNFDTISQQIYKHGEAIATERTVNKYENRSGLPQESTNVIVDDTQQQLSEFLNRVARGK